MRIGRERRWAQRQIRTLRLPDLPTLDDAVQAVADMRGRPILVTHRRLPAAVSGFCAQFDDRDVIVVDETASPLNRILIASHELAHLWRGHRPDDGSIFDTATARALLPGMNPDVVRIVLMGRSHYGPPLEREAELLATQLVSLLDLGHSPAAITEIASALTNRRTGV
ncbi:ImmA/IrrE family metallo-endopeptidase [Streptomyces sp. TRM66268-LWL]|uniref:ImmA/IrrE family metallo-endopeptidase n=1 Tax=Streptomyces polyasparticus TaxID=2767826 RepID=A0ABR7STT5_9ACTN|nr:ImmA/IrrE family metallo-endopeptidase [Streptomyces polyasparticus]MBC9718895.1 ImmA/IrrE family metallo-endopeptidase [Streptomyces polyasparticus]